MRLPSCLFVAALALGGCSQTGQTALQASLAPDLASAPLVEDSGAAQDARENQIVTTGATGLAAFFAPPSLVQTAQAVEPIPGEFITPDNLPLPPARPDFGDRVQVADASPQGAPQTSPLGIAESALPVAAVSDVTGSTPRADAPTPAQASVEAASLGAYEFKTAGVPLPAGGLSATNVAFAPAQFEIAGAGASTGRSGGMLWRAAYDHVDTSCFPQTLRRALDQIAAHFQSEVLVTSGMRDRGRRGSLHRSCKAADIRVVGVSPGEVARVARNIPGVNGVGTYRRVGVTHIDVRAERFAWRW
jgi:hypothetical protein